ncbi:MAG: histidinol phosphate phosphatase domain-containing protein [Methanopyri archaeon]|nr:histidinol phosphate phosphatase domain-containing protein [Methanopyri archaeon]
MTLEPDGPDRRYELHAHSYLVDGELLPSELLRRAEVKDHAALVFAEHVDVSNLEDAVTTLAETCDELRGYYDVEPIPGAELTHVPPETIPDLAESARDNGARVVLVHGETPAEPVAPGTNEAAVRCDAVDVLAHPGLIEPELAAEAAENDVALELTTKRGHCLANGWVARVAMEVRAPLVLNTDAHVPGDLLTPEEAAVAAMGAGVPERMLKWVLEEVPRRLINP